MVFTFPNYLDHPNLHQFQQHQEHHQQQPIGVENRHLHPVEAPPPPLVVGGIDGAGLIRPGSMVDRARLAELPPPEAGARCPRCDSTNTKFCYYNNYNLSQPRHFCKGCRRYWTKGGSLRNVPVGGGCRRNKRSKSNGSSSSKSKGGDERQLGTKNNSNNSSTTGAITNINMVGHHFQQTSTQSPFMGALHNFNQYAATESGSHQLHGLEDIRFSIGGNNSAEPCSSVWLLPSFQGGFDPPTNNFFQFQREGVENRHQLPLMVETRSSDNISSMKVENHQNRNQELNLSSTSEPLDPSETRQTNWDENAWTTNGFSGLNYSSSSRHL